MERITHVKESATTRKARATIRTQTADIVLNTATKMLTKKLTVRVFGAVTMKVINVTEVAMAVEVLEEAQQIF
jgi:hypothetical protein